MKERANHSEVKRYEEGEEERGGITRTDEGVGQRESLQWRGAGSVAAVRQGDFPLLHWAGSVTHLQRGGDKFLLVAVPSFLLSQCAA